MRPFVLSIGGSDPSGGAGIQADLKTLHQHGVVGGALVTLHTVQNSRGVTGVEVRDIAREIDTVFEDGAPAAIKTGALGSAANVVAVAERLHDRSVPLVVDPVRASTSGAVFLDKAAWSTLQRELLPLATLVTPNCREASALAGLDVVDVKSARRAAEVIAEMGPTGVLVKGGHLEGDPIDVLWHRGEIIELAGTRIAVDARGTGCALSAAIAASLALGVELPEACRRAKAWLARALEGAVPWGKGRSILDHHAPVRSD